MYAFQKGIFPCDSNFIKSLSSGLDATVCKSSLVLVTAYRLFGDHPEHYPKKWSPDLNDLAPIRQKCRRYYTSKYKCTLLIQFNTISTEICSEVSKLVTVHHYFVSSYLFVVHLTEIVLVLTFSMAHPVEKGGNLSSTLPLHEV